MLSLLLLSYIFLCNSQIFPSNWQYHGCIPEDEYFVCISIDSLRNLDWIRNFISYINVEIISTSSSLSPIYSTNKYRIDNTNDKDINDLSICFYPNITTTSNPSIQFNIYNITNNDHLFIASYTIQNIHSLNMTINESPIQFTESWQNITNTLNISQMNLIPQIRFSLWLSSSQCMEITTATMYFANDYNLNTNMYRLTNKNKPSDNTIFQTGKFTSFHSSPSFNSIFCLPGYPMNNTQGLIGANFTLNDDTTGQSYSLSTVNDESMKFYISPKLYWEQTSYDMNKLHFAMGNIKMNYWQSCSLSNITMDILTTDSIDLFDSVAGDTMYYTLILLAVLLFIILICMFSGCYTCKSYKGTDPMHYSNILWCLLAIWDFFSQILFAMFLILQITEIGDSESNNEILLILFVTICCALLISYLCNLLYLIHYLQIWNDPSAPGVTRHWLELWSWLIIFITMTMGGVHVALEFCNSIIIPIDVFSMHLSHSELIRTRKDRFITNVLIQDIPIFIIILIYIFLFHFEEILNGMILFQNISYIVIINVLLCTLLSIFTTTIFRILRRNYSHDNPIAQYQFSFTLKSNEWQSHWIHSHKKIQKCFKLAFALRKLSLTIIDQCSESLNSMKIEGRLLRDNKWKSERVEKMATGDVTRDEMREIGLDLLREFKKEFDLLYSNDIRIDHLTIKPISDGDQIVYNHRTCVQILCVGLKDCCHSICNKLCPSFIKPPPNRRQSTMPIQIESPRDDDDGYNIKPPPPPKMMQLSVDKSKESSRSNSNNRLPMITISSQLEHLRDSIDETDKNNIISKHITDQNSFDFSGSNPGYINKRDNQRKPSQYKSPKNNEHSLDKESSQSSRNNKLDQHTLFADVYNDPNTLKKLNEDKEATPPPHNPPNIINPQEIYTQIYKHLKEKEQENNRKSIDQYGYKTKRKITFKSGDDRIKEIAGDAPEVFSNSANNLMNNNNNNNNNNHHQNMYENDDNSYSDDEEVDI